MNTQLTVADIHAIFASVRRPGWKPGEMDDGLVVRFALAVLSTRSATLSGGPAAPLSEPVVTITAKEYEEFRAMKAERVAAVYPAKGR